MLNFTNLTLTSPTPPTPEFDPNWKYGHHAKSTIGSRIVRGKIVSTKSLNEGYPIVFETYDGNFLRFSLDGKECHGGNYYTLHNNVSPQAGVPSSGASASGGGNRFGGNMILSLYEYKSTDPEFPCNIVLIKNNPEIGKPRYTNCELKQDEVKFDPNHKGGHKIIYRMDSSVYDGEIITTKGLKGPIVFQTKDGCCLLFDKEGNSQFKSYVMKNKYTREMRSVKFTCGDSMSCLMFTVLRDEDGKFSLPQSEKEILEILNK